MKRENLENVPTILRRIVFPISSGWTKHEVDAEVLKSDSERNTVYALTEKRVVAALAAKDAGKLKFVLDSLGDDLGGDEPLRLVHPENGAVRMVADVGIFATVADPALGDSFLKLPEFVRAQVDAVRAKKPGALFLALWPDGRGDLLQIYSYYV